MELLTRNKKQVEFGYEPSEPMTIETIENRTLDRIQDLFESGQERFETLKSILIKSSMDPEIVNILERISETYMALVRCSSFMDSIITRWSNVSQDFYQFCAEELLLNDDQDATFSNGSSIFSEVRQGYRDTIRTVLAMENVSIDTLYLPMKVSSTSGLNSLGSCHPPSTSGAISVSR